MGPVDLQPVQQQAAMPRVVRHADRSCHAAAVAETGTVVAQKPIALREPGLAEKRLGPRGGDAPMDQDDRLARSSELICELDAVDLCAIHPLHDRLPPR